MFTHIFLCYIQTIFHALGKTSVPLARHRYDDADALGEVMRLVLTEVMTETTAPAPRVVDGHPKLTTYMLHGLSDALTRYLNVRSNNREAAADAKK
jgi:hypothetical protein